MQSVSFSSNWSTLPKRYIFTAKPSCCYFRFVEIVIENIIHTVHDFKLYSPLIRVGCNLELAISMAVSLVAIKFIM
jgi:hypothetical protein